MAARKERTERRAMVLASIVLMVAGINMVVLGVVISGGADSHVAHMRIETLKAFLAAESGVHLCAGELAGGRTPPAGELELASGETLEITLSGSAAPYTCTITGRYQQGERRIELEIE